MKTHNLLLAAALLAPVFAGVPSVVEHSGPCKRVSGNASVGYDTNYTVRGMVAAKSLVKADSTEHASVRLSYDPCKKRRVEADKGGAYRGAFRWDARRASRWGFDTTLSYRHIDSAHGFVADQPVVGGGARVGDVMRTPHLQDEFAVTSALRYTGRRGSVSFGHNFVHGGYLGQLARHYNGKSSSCVNELYISPAVYPKRWLETGMTMSYSVQGMEGWWFEPYVTFKRPLRGSWEDPRVMGMLTLGMSATADYFSSAQGLNSNGIQSWWVQASAPCRVGRRCVVTPYVGLHWAGSGALHANHRSAAHAASGNAIYPWRSHDIVAGVSVSFFF